jgi:hypothetical protein
MLVLKKLVIRKEDAIDKFNVQRCLKHIPLIPRFPFLVPCFFSFLDTFLDLKVPPMEQADGLPHFLQVVPTKVAAFRPGQSSKLVTFSLVMHSVSSTPLIKNQTLEYKHFFKGSRFGSSDGSGRNKLLVNPPSRKGASSFHLPPRPTISQSSHRDSI